jgi:hypothetical protein
MPIFYRGPPYRLHLNSTAGEWVIKIRVCFVSITKAHTNISTLNVCQVFTFPHVLFNNAAGSSGYMA